MQFLILAALLGTALSAPSDDYSGSGPILSRGPTYSGGGGLSRGIVGGLSGGIGGYDGGNVGGAGYGVQCSGGQVLHVDGSCVQPEVSRDLYVYSAPDLPVSYGPKPYIPPPRVNYNVVFVRTPEGPHEIDPIVVPPPQERTLVYVLTRNGQIAQRVIEVPAGPNQAPEVLYVNYDEGDNTILPDGTSLQDALRNSVAVNGQLVGGGGGAGLGGSGVLLSGSGAGYGRTGGGYGGIGTTGVDGVIVGGIGGGIGGGYGQQSYK